MDKFVEKPIVTEEEKEWLDAFDHALLERNIIDASPDDFRKSNIIRNKLSILENGWFHIQRQHRFSKSQMSGLVKGYQELYNILKPLDEYPDGILFGMGWLLGDMPFHGWVGDAAKEENRTYHAVADAYTYLMYCLEDALGIGSYGYAGDLINSPDGQFVLINTKNKEIE